MVLFDPDWNPAVDKQAAARCWRDGQKKRCFTYRFLATGTVEEKIFQRQLSKEGLQSVVDDKEQVNALSTKDLRNLFKLRVGTPSDTHDKLRCDRCAIIHDNAEMEAAKILPEKLAKCEEVLNEMEQQPDAKYFLCALDPTEHGCSKENYEKLVKQPMDFGAIRSALKKSPDQPSAYHSVSSFSKDVNRVFANVLKVWDAGQEIADAARRLQTWWTERWGGLVPVLMSMKGGDDTKTVSGEETCIPTCAVTNERGDDYQEQIGMPDEENMRHWSHHHSTDTVDDPVFRAAMRGYDAVSFVFGLEVTWSLIQQRQQEEEERLAMEALENCARSEGHVSEAESKEDDHNPVSSSKDTESASRKPIEDQGDWSSSDEEEEIDSGSSLPRGEQLPCQDQKDLPPQENGSSSQTTDTLDEEDSVIEIIECEDDEEVTSKSNLKPSTQATLGKRSIFSDSSDDDDSPRKRPHSSQTSTDINEKNKRSEWQCAACTLLNAASKRKCSACGSKKAT